MKNKELQRVKKCALEAITFAIDELQNDLRICRDAEENLTRAEAIKKLAEAFREIAES
jgi:hypothetical protein